MCALISGHFCEPKMTSECSNDLAAEKDTNKRKRNASDIQNMQDL